MNSWFGGGTIMFHEFPDVVNVIQMRTMLGIGRNTAYNLINDGIIPSIRIGKVHRITKANIIKYIKGTKRNN